MSEQATVARDRSRSGQDGHAPADGTSAGASPERRPAGRYLAAMSPGSRGARIVGFDLIFSALFFGTDYGLHTGRFIGWDTDWYPAAGLVFAFFLVRGWQGSFALFGAAVLSHVAPGRERHELLLTVVWASTLTGSYLALAAYLRAAKLDLRSLTIRQMTLVFMATMAAAFLPVVLWVVAFESEVSIDVIGRAWAGRAASLLTFGPIFAILLYGLAKWMKLGEPSFAIFKVSPWRPDAVVLAGRSLLLAGLVVLTIALNEATSYDLRLLVALPLFYIAASAALPEVAVALAATGLPFLLKHVFVPSDPAVLPDEVLFLSWVPFAIFLSIAMERQRSLVSERTILSDIARLITSSHRIEEVYALVMQALRPQLSWDRTVIALINRADRTYVDAYIAGVRLPGPEPGVPHALDGSLTGLVVATDRSLVMTAPTAEELAAQFPPLANGIPEGLCSALSVPLISRGEIVGAIHWRSRGFEVYTAEDVLFAEKVAEQITGAVLNAELQRRTSRYASEQRALAAIGVAANSETSLERICEVAAREIETLIPFDRIVFTAFLDRERRLLRGVYTRGVFVPTMTPGASLPVAFDEPGFYRKDIGAILFDRMEQWAEGEKLAKFKESGLNSWVEVALGPKDRALGYLALRSKEVGAYTEREVTLLKLVAAQITPALQNSLLVAELEQRVEERTRQLQLANQAQKRFVSIAAHELKTPLTSVVGFTELLEMRADGLNAMQRHWLATMKASGLQMNRLVEDLLDYSRIETGNIKVEKEDFDLRELVSSAVTSSGPQFRGRSQDILLSLCDEPLPVHADRSRIRQVLDNLLSNASKYSAEGTQVLVDASRHDGQAAVTVTDCGIGISGDDQAKLFRPFYRAENEATRNIQGAGLGLALSQALMGLHAGEITVRSEPGAGSTFTATLPLRNQPERGTQIPQI